MLTELSVKNLVLIDHSEMEFSDGLNVLTGETGAGKSLLLNALGLILGNRADTSLIKQDTDALSVTAVFNDCLQNKNLCEICKEYELEVDDEIIIKRVLNKDGRGKIFFNNDIISQKMLKDLAENLVEINGQFASHSLLNTKNHLQILDDCGNYTQILQAVKEKFIKYKLAQKNFETANAEYKKAQEDEYLMRHFADELEKLSPQPDEEQVLQQRRQEMLNAEKIAENFNYAHQILSSKINMCDAIRQAQTYIGRNNHLLDNKYAEFEEMLETALINIANVTGDIETILQNLEFDVQEQNQVEERLFALRAAAKKHGVEIRDLPAVLDDLHHKLSLIQSNGEELTALANKVNSAKLDYLQEAKKLSAERKQNADIFAQNVMNELIPLKMEKAKFVVKIEELPEVSWTEKGIDTVEFCVATNPNSPLGSIEKIASGGELSRLMLAIKVNLTDSNMSCMVFDEIDSGIGGATADAVGERLSRLSHNVQVLVVTHSPQVAAKGSSHFKVEKQADLLCATTQVHKLSKNEKIEEIARMISGENISDEARAAAKILINK